MNIQELSYKMSSAFVSAHLKGFKLNDYNSCWLIPDSSYLYELAIPVDWFCKVPINTVDEYEEITDLLNFYHCSICKRINAPAVVAPLEGVSCKINSYEFQVISHFEPKAFFELN